MMWMKDLKAANWAVKNLHKHIHLFRLISSMQLPKIMGLQDIHSPDALHHCGGLAFCPWCGKEGIMRVLLSITCKLHITSWD